MYSITKSIRISKEQENYLLSCYKNVNQGVQECIDKVRNPLENDKLDILEQIRTFSRRELKGRFTKDEWKVLISSINAYLAEARFRCSPDLLIFLINDAEKENKYAQIYGVNLPLLIDKVNNLTGAQIEALFTYVDEFWYNKERNLDITANELT